MKPVKIQIPGKIYFNGFTRQLKELYYLLAYESYILAEWDEFFTHFTGKKITLTPKPGRKMKWSKEKYLITPLIIHLVEKNFLDGTVEENIELIKEHFEGIPVEVIKRFNENETTSSVRNLQKKLEMLFPATSGYRCKERLFYKARNKEPQLKVLENCGIKVPL